MTTSLQDLSVLQTLSNSLADMVEKTGRSLVAINGRRRKSATGVYWRSQIIVTTEQAVKRDDELAVTLPNGDTIAATLVGRDAGTDLAVLRLNDELADIPTAAIADTATLKVGHIVLAIGRSLDNGVSASLGVISALSGGWRTWHGGRIDQFVRPSLTLYPGFSGGPLVDATGQVVGINTTGPRYMALTIPTATVNRVVDQLLQGGRVARGYLGLGMQSVQLPEALKQSLNLDNAGGVIVVSVEPDAPADKAGILLGDILIALDGTPIHDVSDVHSLLDPDRVGTALHAQIIRGGGLIELTITIGERPGKEV